MDIVIYIYIIFPSNKLLINYIYITEYIVDNSYTIYFTRQYPLFWYKLLDDPSPSTDQKYIYVSALDTRNNEKVLLIINPNSATCEILIKIHSFEEKVLQFIPIKTSLDTYSLIYVLIDIMVPYDLLMIVNINPFLYGNFSEATFEQLYQDHNSSKQFDLMFSNIKISLKSEPLRSLF